MQRRTLLRLSAAAAAGAGVSLLGSGQGHTAPVNPLGTAPTTPFAVGVRRYDWRRGSRTLTTYVYYPATGTPGGNPVTNAPVADGVFPVYNFMITHGLLTSWPDSRIISANPQSCVDMGSPASSVRAKVLFVHGDRDSTTQYSSARQAYSQMPAPKAFLTFVGGSHTSFWSDRRFPNTAVDWAR
ncbi:alpha/beta hydrolase [Micromonospora sp. KC213]|uniref:alpha/beta hydrolase n=1 Tax=Micromonospora sp. KC213 TaxID=2530378 RepID=UPI001404905C|nr:alpha/beta hydrolase [Micromonospora sp. KC213]